jgi:hypothetical protein
MWHKKNSENVVALLQRTQLSVYRSSAGKIVSLPFDPKLVQDLEVLDEDGFCRSLALFFQQQKLTKASVILVLDSSVYFSQKAPEIDVDHQLKLQLETIEKEKSTSKTDEKAEVSTKNSEIENQKKVFAHSVPFANVFSTVVTIGKEKFFVALNRDFYEPVIQVLSEKDLCVEAILPIAVVTTIFQTGGFTPEVALQLINTIDKYRAHDFLENSIKKDDTQIVAAMPSDPSDKKRLMMMSIVFVVLIGLLVAVILWSRQRDQQLATVTPSAVIDTSTPLPTALPSPTPEITALELSELLQSSPSGVLVGSQYTVAIIAATDDAEAVNTLIEQLKTVGFTKVSRGQKTATLTGQVVVSVTDDVSLELQEALEKQMAKWNYKTSFTVEPEQPNNIEITLTSQ